MEKDDLAQTLRMSLEELETYCRSMRQDELALLDWWRPKLRAAAASLTPNTRPARLLDGFITNGRVLLRGYPLMLEAWGEEVYGPRIEALVPGLVEHPLWESYRSRVVAASAAMREWGKRWETDHRSGVRHVFVEELRNNTQQQQAAGPSTSSLTTPVPSPPVPQQQMPGQAATPSSPPVSALAPSGLVLPVQPRRQMLAPMGVRVVTDPFPAGRYTMSSLWDRIVSLTQVRACPSCGVA